jgi:hypothetical protein
MSTNKLQKECENPKEKGKSLVDKLRECLGQAYCVKANQHKKIDVTLLEEQVENLRRAFPDLVKEYVDVSADELAFIMQKNKLKGLSVFQSTAEICQAKGILKVRT